MAISTKPKGLTVEITDSKHARVLLYVRDQERLVEITGSKHVSFFLYNYMYLTFYRDLTVDALTDF